MKQDYKKLYAEEVKKNRIIKKLIKLVLKYINTNKK